MISPLNAAIPVAGFWQVSSAEAPLTQDQYYPRSNQNFRSARFDLSRLNDQLDPDSAYYVLIRNLSSNLKLSLEPGNFFDTVLVVANEEIFQFTGPFPTLASITFKVQPTSATPDFPLLQIINSREYNQYESCKPVQYRTIGRIPIFNRQARAWYNLKTQQFEDFKRWVTSDATDPLAASNFFKSLSFTITVDGESLSLALDAVLTRADYIPSTGILRVEYLLNDDNHLTITAIVPASYSDPIFLVLAEMTTRPGQKIEINTHIALDRPDIAFIDRNLPGEDHLVSHLTVLAHSAESIKIARRYVEILSVNPQDLLNRETSWWLNWHRGDRIPTGLTKPQQEIWLQALTFLEISPSPIQPAAMFHQNLMRAWGFAVSGHADEASDELGLLLDQFSDSLSLARWGQFLQIARLTTDQLGYSHLIQSNWQMILNNFGEKVIRNFTSLKMADSISADQLMVLAGIQALGDLADKMGVSATAYVFQRLSNQLINIYGDSLSGNLSKIPTALMPELLVNPQLLQTYPDIIQSLYLQHTAIWRIPGFVREAPDTLAYSLDYFRLIALRRMAEFPKKSALQATNPILIRSIVNAHLFPTAWDCQGRFQQINLISEFWTTCLLALTPPAQP